MSYEESKLFSLLKKQDINSLFLEATNYLYQTKSLFEEKEQLQQENEQQKEIIDKIESLIKSKDNGTCIHNNERRGAYTFVLDFDEAREFVWNLEDILKEVSE